MPAPPKGKPSEQAAPEQPKLTQQVHMGPGDLTTYTLGLKREQAWTVRWKDADLDITEGAKQQGGEMRFVTGQFFKEGKPASEFSAAVGHADKSSGVLTLSGNAVVRAENPTVIMRCDQVEWDARIQILKAKGNVTFDETGYTLGTMKELWCSPDLKHMATPDLFSKT